eukprot:354121-Chlamydomonas_euryale.AAC.2
MSLSKHALLGVAARPTRYVQAWGRMIAYGRTCRGRACCGRACCGQACCGQACRGRACCGRAC